MQLSMSSRVGLARPAAARAGVRPLPMRPALRMSPRMQANSGIDSDELQAKAQELASQLKDKWEKTEDKPGAVVVISGTILALSLALSLVNAIDRIPVISDLIELVGIGVSGWATYRYLTVGPDRDELFISIKQFINKVYGQF